MSQFQVGFVSAVVVSLLFSRDLQSQDVLTGEAVASRADGTGHRSAFENEERSAEKASPQFLDEAVAGWERRASRITKRAATITSSYEELGEGSGEFDSGKTENVTSRDVFLCGGLLRVLNTSGVQKRQTAVVENEEYSFRLLRDDEKSPWVIANLEYASDSVAQKGRSDFRKYAYVVFAPVSVDGVLLKDLFADPSFHLKDTTQHDGLVEFSFQSDYDQDGLNHILGGRVVLAPDRDWNVVEYYLDLQSSDAGSVTGQLEYQETENGEHVLSRFAETYEFPDGRHRYVHSVKNVRQCELEDSEFRLAAFGLQEPPSGLPTGRVRFLFIANFVLVIACLLIYFFVRFARTEKTEKE